MIGNIFLAQLNQFDAQSRSSRHGILRDFIDCKLSMNG